MNANMSHTIAFTDLKDLTQWDHCLLTGKDLLYIDLHPTFQRKYEAWDNNFKTSLIESMLLGQVMNPIWTVFNNKKSHEEIFDGMHRLCTALAFQNNEFCLKPNGLWTLDKKNYGNKFYRDLSTEDRRNFMLFKFDINKLDSSYLEDKRKGFAKYNHLNRSSAQMNNFELNKYIRAQFDELVGKVKDNFLKTTLFRNMKDSRGKIETEIIHMFVIAHSLPNSWTCLEKLENDWFLKEFGEHCENIEKVISDKQTVYEEKFKNMIKFIEDFERNGMYVKDGKTFKHMFVPYKFIVSRCGFKIKSYSSFQRHLPKLLERFNEEILVENIQEKLKCTSRNAKFQKLLIAKIDNIIDEETYNDDPRRFSKKIIQEKLDEQNYQCPECKQDITDDKYEADHITPWTVGGKTIKDNCQILHTRCHQKKSA